MNEEVNGKISLLGNGFTAIDTQRLLQIVKENVEARRRMRLVFLNVDVVMKAEKDALLKRIINEAEYVLPDGMPLIWISRLFKKPLKEKVSGSDFVPLVCEQAAEAGHSIFFMGGRDEVRREAVRRVRETYPGIRIVGSSSPPNGFEKDPEEVDRLNEEIRRASPDILVVCLGCPKQEKFVYENQQHYDVPVSICAGATIDFLAGSVKRCPAWMSQCGLEWFYRFLQEPRRLFKRYFIDDIQILGLVFKYRKERNWKLSHKKELLWDERIQEMEADIVKKGKEKRVLR